ncbi:MAG: hypothetical protein ACRBDL_00520 [Alphaproteobacteria bacterium]
MLQISDKFKDAHGNVRQPLSYERILETCDTAHQKLHDFLVDCNKSFDGISFHVADDKNPITAANKAMRDYGGDKRRVTDYVRGKTMVQSPDTIRALTGRDFEHLMHKHGIEVAGMNNYFKEPKDDTGYRCINYKLAIPVGVDKNGDIEQHIVELQVVAAQIEKRCEETHKYKRRAEEAGNQIELLMQKYGNVRELKYREIHNDKLTPEEKERLTAFEYEAKPYRKIAQLNYAASRLINGQTARGSDPKTNYEALLDPDQKSKHFLFPGREEHLASLKFKADLMVYENE